MNDAADADAADDDHNTKQDRDGGGANDDYLRPREGKGRKLGWWWCRVGV